MVLAAQRLMIHISLSINILKQRVVCHRNILLLTDLCRRAARKYEAFQQGIACQTISAMYTITGSLSHRIQLLHGSPAVVVYPYTAHEVMLGRHYRNTLLRHIIALLAAVFHNIGKMRPKLFLRNRSEILPHIIGVILFHLVDNSLGDHISRQQFIHKPVHILVIQPGTLTPDRFRDQKAPLFLHRRVQCGRMHLHIIDILQSHIMLQCNGQRIPRQMTEIRGMPVQTSDSAASPHCVLRLNGLDGSIRHPKDRSVADIILTHNVHHDRIFKDGYIRQFSHLCQELAGDFFSGNILVKEDPLIGVRSLTGKHQLSVLIPCEIRTVAHQVLNHLPGGADHDFDGLPVVLIMSCLQGILKITVIIGFIFQHTDSTLSKKRITAFHIPLGDDGNLLISRKLQCTV